MKLSIPHSLILFLLLLLPVSCFAGALDNSSFSLYAHIISYMNVALEITSIICIKQFFFLGDRNQTNFQIFNLCFGVVFYLIALSFLVEQKSFYGFDRLSASQCIGRFFFNMGIYSWLQWLVIVAMGINTLYIGKYKNA